MGGFSAARNRMTPPPNDTPDSDELHDSRLPEHRWRAAWPLWLRLGVFMVGVSAGCAGVVLVGRSLAASRDELLALAVVGGAASGMILGLLLVVIPAWLAAGERWALIRLIDNLSNVQRKAGFEALLRLGDSHELSPLARAIHGALTSAHADRVQAAALRRDMDSRVARQTRLATAHLTKQSMTDELTGLANRRGFEAAMAAMTKNALESGDELALLAIDLDHFKQLNDALGHDKGDAALRAVGEILRGHLRETDLAARLGGDEFVVVLYGLRAAESREIAQRLGALLAHHPEGKGLPCKWITMSTGIALLRGSGAMDADKLRRLADEALYAVKRNGRGGVSLWGDSASRSARAAA